MSAGIQPAPRKFVNCVPIANVKKEVLQVEDTVSCKLCPKGFASVTALNNHARMEHIDTYCQGDPTAWTMEVAPKNVPKTTISIEESDDDQVMTKTKQLISEMKPVNYTTLASNDVSYIIIKADDLPAMKKKKVEQKKAKKDKECKPITGPFECLQPSALMRDGACHQMFFSCCEYSAHYRDEHTRRRKGLRCQVCEKPLACNGRDTLYPYNCDVCGEGFESNEELSAHTLTAHKKHKPYECNVCHKRFTQLGGVLQHMRLHTGDRPFACGVCAKTFTQKAGLEQHTRIHTKVRPYRCVLCTKSFGQSVHLQQHIRTHTKVAPFQCGICDRRFKQSSHLNYHLKNHKYNNMTEEQKAKYTQLVGMMKKEIVEVEVDPSPVDLQSMMEVEVIEDEPTVNGGEITWSSTSTHLRILSMKYRNYILVVNEINK